MERHDTHLLSCSSSMDNSYKYDKNGNLILGSLSSISFVNNKKENKIKASELFIGLNQKNENIIKDEEDIINKNININNLNKDNNITFFNKEKNNDKDNNNLNDNKNFQIIPFNHNFMYITFGKENKNENNNINEDNMKIIKEGDNKNNNNKNNNNKNNHIKIKQEVNFNYMVKKYDNKYLKVINIISLYLKPQKNKYNNKIIIIKDESSEEKNKTEIKKESKNKYEYIAKFSERMKFSSKTNSFLSPINNIIKEKDIFIKNKENIIKLPLNIKNYCYMKKSPLIIKYKMSNKIVINKLCFYTKKIIRNEQIEESMIFDGFNEVDNKIIKNKFIINDIQDKKSIFNKKNENEYNKDFHNTSEEENNEKNNSFNKNDEINSNSNLLLSPNTTKLYTNNNILKPINIFTNKKPRIINSAFPTPLKPNKIKNTIDNKIKTYHKINELISPSNIRRNKLFNNNNNNDSNISKINSRIKQNRNKSLVNIINNNIINKHYHDKEEENNKNGKKYNRHFGKEENCPICVALQMKNKLLEEKNILPILNKKGIRRNGSAKEIMFNNDNNEKFPCLKGYFNNNNKYN